MAVFLLKSDLPIEDQKKIDAIEAITASARTTTQQAYLDARLPYLTNIVLSVDEDANITAASGLTVPTGFAGFAKGATFIKTDATGNGMYMNTGDATTSAWDLVDQATSSNIDDGAVTIPKLGANVVLGNTHEYYVDGSRTDTYTATGNILTPFKTIKAAQDAINITAATLYDTQAHFELCKFLIHIAPGKYTDAIDIQTVRYLGYDMKGVEISGNIDITQSQLGLSDYYGKVEFIGGAGNRPYRGNCGLISGNIAFHKAAYDSLAYDGFIGINVTGNVSYGTTATPIHGTWVLCLENAYFGNSAKFIEAHFLSASEHLMIESYGYNKILSHLSGQDGSAVEMTLYDCNNTYFDLVNIIPLENCTAKNCTFNSTTAIVASKNLSIDANSYKSLIAQTPTLTGMTIIYLDESVNTASKYTFYVDGNRTDSYTATGTMQCPYKTVASAVTAINTLFTAAADKQTTCYTVNIAAGTYSDAVALSNYKNIRFIGSGVVLSGAITITTSPIGGSGQEPYTRYEFIGTSGIRAEKGKGMTISGNITATRTNDSLVYINFKGCWISGNQLYDTDGTFVTQYENCRVAGTIDTGTFATADSQVLIECTGWNEFAGAITDGVSFYNVENTDFWGAITTTPYFESVFTNTRFHAAVSIVAATSLYMDSYSMKSLFAQTHTLTGQIIVPLDGIAEVNYALSSANILAMNGAPVTILPAVSGKVIVIDDICLKMVTTSTGYANGGAVELRYTDGSGAKVSADIAAAVITAGAGTSYTINKSIVTSLTGVVSSPIVITNADAPFITGTGAGVLTIRYHLV